MLKFEDRSVELRPGETVLEALERAGIDAPSSCRSGNCQTCLHRAVEGVPPPESQVGLTQGQKALGFFLPCVCLPASPLTITRPDDVGARRDAVIRAIEPLAPDVIRLRVDADDFAYRPGQFLELVADGDLRRHYSLASHPEDDPFLEMHIRLHENGRMSRRLGEFKPGDRLHVAGPSGTCFYEGVHEDQRLLLIGAGTGLAPLYGVLRDALKRGHLGPIRLYHGARSRDGLYLDEELKALSRTWAHVDYRPCLLDPNAPAGGDVAATALHAEQDVKDSAIFLCGGENLVKRLKRDFFMRGVSMKNIRSDAFTPSG
ncbi:2Fe-2S iron-sulfur cluster binding domain-containing protein [Methylocystis sp. L43]|jgi:CDP-4-dehydro-6-deoxyglucose reductase|uniref:2Fe-2S iron-sulfur cluster-binding protein n=1 Tax=unclassified Methylocystis TaxID=2625913 RepID=UPI0018C1EA44|nr:MULTISPECIES: 2Fe-2S iron-sulfur cluster binding domain-containing protein [unclassified Methylocystis]MBG0797440.1 2Fe-2S iron-sulfur cluster binding domain-containing protein [Methylocystis sp. L43]MBG0807707.1 2Fe-2S iron-sulfur cluster binding domain-containing protein [Methylocystis sp. H15]